MKDYSQVAKEIINLVGGEENVNRVTHCMTRLRFNLKDSSKVDKKALEDLDLVVKVIDSAGQIQVVIGQQVADVYKAMVGEGLEKKDSSSDKSPVKEIREAEEKKGPGAILIDNISNIFVPVIPIISATGLLKGILALFAYFGLMAEGNATYDILYAISDSAFYYLPVLLGYSAFKKFGGSPMLGITMGAIMVYPSIVGFNETHELLFNVFEGSILQSPVHGKFLGIPMIMMNYASSVVPIVITSFFGAKLEKKLREFMPDSIKGFMVPLITLVVIMPLSFLVIGPITTWLSNLLGFGINAVYGKSAILAGILLGALWQVMVIFGLHWTIAVLTFTNLAAQGFDTLFPLAYPASFAQIGVVLGILLKTKDKKLKSMSIPAFITGITGVTEPAIYGITLPRKKFFGVSCVGAALSGAIMGLNKVKLYQMSGIGIFGFPSFIDTVTKDASGIKIAILASVVGFIFSFVVTYVMYNDKDFEHLS